MISKNLIQTPSSLQVGLALAAGGALMSSLARGASYLHDSKIKQATKNQVMWTGLIGQTLQNVATMVPVITYSVRWLIDSPGPLQVKAVFACGLSILGLLTSAVAVTPIIAGKRISKEYQVNGIIDKFVANIFKAVNQVALVSAGICGKLNIYQGMAYALCLIFASTMEQTIKLKVSKT